MSFPGIWPWRRAFQALGLLSLFGFPLMSRYGHYLAARQLDKAIEAWAGTLQGRLLSWTDALVRIGIPDGEGGVPERRPRKKILARTRNFYGSVWAARLGPLSLVDLLAFSESSLSTRSIRRVLLAGALIPLAVSVLLGRVYCGWICPVGLLLPMLRRLRGLLSFLELPPPAVDFDRRLKYGILAAGSLIALITGLPLLHAVYPPALLGREAHGFVAALFDAAEAGRFGPALAGLTGASLFLAAIAVVEVLLAPGFWCRSVCPGGALYSLLGRFRLLRIRRAEAACTDCALCDRACPMGLAPMTDKTGGECDNCGVCVDFCPTGALGFSLARADKTLPGPRPGKRAAVPAGLAAVLVCVFAAAGRAHHIMGIPHYAYDENYPQAPVMKLVERVGGREMQLTGYPGNPAPGVRTEVHAYAYETSGRAVYEGPLSLTVRRLSPFGGAELVHGPEEARRDGSLAKFYPTYPEEGNYELTLRIADPAAAEGFSTLRFPMVVGEPGSPWSVLAMFAGAFLALTIVVRAVKIKRARRRAAGARA